MCQTHSLVILGEQSNNGPKSLTGTFRCIPGDKHPLLTLDTQWFYR